ncbi:MAG: ribosome biogenesis GTPase Der, partial [Waddliaceae bacterium]|nr:ribosome biogenesis GTPase Der [Waddliaceae bacterium]
GVDFEVIDTGGIALNSPLPFNEEVKQQASIAIEEADSIIFVVDGTVGTITLDVDVANILKRSGKPLILAVNKVDTLDQERLIHDFHGLGISNIVGVSALHGINVAEMLEGALSPLSSSNEGHYDSGATKVAIIGRPNVGKSTLINTLVDERRCVVSPIAGTTRDSIDIEFSYKDSDYVFIDTAGIRRKTSEHEVVDKFASIRTERAVERADICALMIDAQQGMTTQEKKIARMIEEKGKGCILLFNKWDLVKGFRMEHCLGSIREEIPFLKHCPAIFISALDGRNLDKLFDEIHIVKTASETRISTPQLNDIVSAAMARVAPPMIQGKRLKIYYLTQTTSTPPTFIIFVNKPKLMGTSYKRYIYNQLRKTHPFTGMPVNFILRGKQQKTMINSQ